MLIISFALLIIINAVTVTVWLSEIKKRKDPFSFEHEKKHVPDERDFLSPAVVVKLLSRRGLSANDVTAGLLSLVTKEALRLSEKKGFESPFFIDQTHRGRDGKLTQDERFLLEWICYDIGSNGTFHVTDLEVYTSNNGKMEEYLHNLYEWERSVIETMKSHQFYRPLNFPRMVLIGNGAAGIAAGSVLLFFAPFIGLGIFLSSLLSLGLIYFISPHTAAGRMEEQKWQKYYEYIKNAGSEAFNSDDITKSFVYAVAFRVADRFLTRFSVQEAGEIKVSQEPFPLYYVAPTGTAVLSLEGVKMYRDLEQGFDLVENAPVAFGDNTDGTGLDNV
ncbi:DUF2207 domain-containing protein [Bacillus sp. H-16]|uniref:DUF2207 family protein n=1 Tax=Alteribacter salitolerans TaxID=2912333 RepID=UPI00196432F0|nr:DUF2207 domain-containing protein [Alteribacter salitolerans]MBM7094326.1 DUF2207 domain-containing protein [Alteribacter salitolerans]